MAQPNDQANRKHSPLPKKPPHLRRRFRPGGLGAEVENLLARHGLHTVCQSAHCPNLGECFGRGTAAFLILGDTCTRHCRFCAIASGRAPLPLNPAEQERIAEVVRELRLSYVVITSVTRDDLPLGGAEFFAACIERIKSQCPGVKIEVLTPDFQGDLRAGPDVFNHNVETVPELYPAVRPQANYRRSLEVLRFAADWKPPVLVKSGLMVGLGETTEQVHGVLDDLRAAGCRIVTIGQYLAPSPAHLPVAEYVAPERFEWYRREALQRGFFHVASAPFVRSSYRAREMFS